jgi:hypothetical protein
MEFFGLAFELVPTIKRERHAADLRAADLRAWHAMTRQKCSFP